MARALTLAGHDTLRIDSEPQRSATDWINASVERLVPVARDDKPTLDRNVRGLERDYVVIMSVKPLSDKADHGSGGDRTARAVSRQFKAMGCDLYMIGVREASTGKMMNRMKTPEEIMEGLPWLKSMNANGNDIYVRPADDLGHGLVLVDDLDRAGLERMRGDGVGPAVVIETSADNFQAWIKLSGEEVPAAVRGEVAKRLAKTYGADPASAGARHYGRLAGFTNRKEKYVDPSSGRRPWVLCRESGGRQAAIGPDLARQASVSPEAAAAADEDFIEPDDY